MTSAKPRCSAGMARVPRPEPRPLPGNRNGCKAWGLSGAKDAVGRTTVIADGGYRDTGLVIPHRRERGQAKLPDWQEEHNTSQLRVVP